MSGSIPYYNPAANKRAFRCVHYRVDSSGRVACGIVVYASNATTDRAAVTCKSCLRHLRRIERFAGKAARP